MKPKIYLASGWFNPEQKKQMDEIYRVLIDFKLKSEIDLFAPYYDGIVLKGKSDPDWRKKMKEVWDLDIKELSSSDLVVASTQDHDVGTIFECGYASACNIPILCYNSNPELGLNVMLAQEARGFIKGPDKLIESINSFLNFLDKNDGTQFISQWKFNLWEGDPI